ncbi:oxidoreductase [Devosia sp. WQ 349]|uniref:PDR/VanB family oxidoreductase n=1 Tax=Devosia sp. WQ 349K1 TaxID=2800329 RepID=UPI0019042FFD|nr:PDR/VanB family oxidoreductase [Devosia sp. WQ 349K1]MBK1795878.1 oxidoreductase [Devosia sp. WQ 349K1]
MRNKIEWRNAKVSQVRQIADDVRYIEFAVEGGVPRFDPGSHTNIKVVINAQDTVRTYTIVPSRPGHLAVAVKLHPQSRGGSRFMWSYSQGDAARLTIPENRFELSWRAGHYLLIAGGIGITPIYGMAKALAARGASLRVVFSAREHGLMAFREELLSLLGNRVQFCDNSLGQHADFATEFAQLPADAECYLCGPIGMLEAAKQAWAASGRPISRLRYEVFGDSGLFTEQSFEVGILNRDMSVKVRPDQTLLEALLENGVDMICDCQRGECGLCAVRIVEHQSEVDHRDVFFSAEEKSEGHRMCACVSRFTSGGGVIDVGYRP